MDELALARSTVEDLQGVGSLFLRRQCSIGVLRINFERAATRLRILAPDTAETVRGYIGQMDAIQDRPQKEQYVAVGSMLDRFDRWARNPTPPAPAPAPVPEPEMLVQPEPVAAPMAEPEFLALPSPGASLDRVPPPPPDVDSVPTDPLDAPRRVL